MDLSWIPDNSMNSGNLKRISYGSKFDVDMSWISDESFMDTAYAHGSRSHGSHCGVNLPWIPDESLNSGNLKRISYESQYGADMSWI